MARDIWSTYRLRARHLEHLPSTSATFGALTVYQRVASRVAVRLGVHPQNEVGRPVGAAALRSTAYRVRGSVNVIAYTVCMHSCVHTDTHHVGLNSRHAFMHAYPHTYTAQTLKHHLKFALMHTYLPTHQHTHIHTCASL
jgi:hypothetical protein